VQNRCYAVDGWDRDIREFCTAHDIIYQGFSLLTANRAVLAHPDMLHIARRYERTVSQIVFRFALEVTGTTSAAHMREDLAAFEYRLDRKDILHIECLGEQ
jgi:diketogulonate reductase-like aldo/keto reductase